MHNRGSNASSKLSFGQGIELSTVKSLLKPKLVGGNKYPVGIGAKQRLIAKARTVGMGRGTIASVVGGIDAKEIERAGRIACLAYRKQHMTMAGKEPAHGVNVDFQDGRKPALRLPIEQGPRVAKEITKSVVLAVEFRSTVEKLVQRCWSNQQL